jgi:cytosolic phospholipase A2
MFARIARVSSRKAAIRRTAWVSGPFIAACVWSSSPILLSDSPNQDPVFEHTKSLHSSQDPRPSFFQSSQQNSNASSSNESEGDQADPAWTKFARKFSAAGDAVGSFEWSSLGDKIAGAIVPYWATSIPSYIRKLQAELSWKPGSLADEILQEAGDPTINPEIEWTARVRIGKDLCAEEKAFQQKRQKHVAQALAKYLDIPEDEIHPDDVPVIAMCGSGGGLRALVAGANSSLCAQEAGLWDCVTYTAGVSGSCWMQALYHSSVSGQDFGALLNHLKKRLTLHIAFPPPALNLLASAPTNKFLLSGLLEKSQADPKADFGLVDVYGLLLAARLLVPRGELEIDNRDLKMSNQRLNVDDGSHPLPIYTAVRHEVPSGEDQSVVQRLRREVSEKEQKQAQQEAWFQWFEWTPYEFFCEEIEAGIPTWSLGRMFENGTSVPRENGLGLPEMRLPQLLGIWGSAFCATLSHYYAEIRPLVKGLAGFGGIDELIEERDSDLIKVHPIDPATIPNFARGLESQLPSHTPASILNDSHLQLMDAGMSNNLPIYPLLRPGRNVDVLIAFDASADPRKDNWLAKVDGYVRQRGIAGWPMGAGWPPEEESAAEAAGDLEAKTKLKAEEGEAQLTAAKAEQTRSPTKSGELGHCTIWLGLTQEREVEEGSQSATESSSATSSESTPSTPPTSSLPSSRSSHSRNHILYDPISTSISSPSDSASPPSSSADWAPLPQQSGLAVVYFPLTANPSGAPGIDPATASYLSTWNFVYTPEEVDEVGKLVRANWEEGAEQTRRCVRAVYERKKRERLERESMRWEERERESGKQVLEVGG